MIAKVSQPLLKRLNTMNSICVILILILYGNVSSDHEKIKSWNERIAESREKSDERKEVEKAVEEINRYNLYRYGEDYKGEVITIEREEYRIND